MTSGSPIVDRDRLIEDGTAPASIDGSDSLASEAGTENSVFRWALESIAERMSLEVPRAQPVVGVGAFAVTPQMPFISLPVAQVMSSRMTELNHALASRVDPSKEGWYPTMAISSEQQRVFSTRPTGENNLLTDTPSEDRLLGALRKQSAPVWSAYIKKARLLNWQTATHQLMGQLSLIENLIKYTGDLVDESSMLASERDQIKGALSVTQKTLSSSERLSTTLGAHLDLSVRDAELRLLELTPFQAAMFRASPLFSRELFGGITRATVEDVTSTRMLSDIHTLAGKGGSKGAASSSKSKAKATPKSTPQPSRAAQPFQGQAAAPQGQQPGGAKKRGKGGKGKKSKR